MRLIGLAAKHGSLVDKIAGLVEDRFLLKDKVFMEHVDNPYYPEGKLINLIVRNFHLEEDGYERIQSYIMGISDFNGIEGVVVYEYEEESNG